MSDNHLQASFLNNLKEEQLAVSIFLVNGIKLHGIVHDYNDEVILLKNSITQMVYKHAISTVVPSRSLNLKTGEED